MYIADAAKLGRVAVPIAEITEGTGLAWADVDDGLADLGELGLVACWDAGAGQVATLTPLAARREGLKIRRISRAWCGLAWVRIDQPEGRDRPRSPARQVRESDLPVSLDRRPGSIPTPDAIAEANEEAESKAPEQGRRLPDSALRADRLPRPRIILTGCQPWGDLARERRRNQGNCPACNDADLGPLVYCCRCGRWGLDWLLDRIRRAERQAELERERAALALPTPSLAERRARVGSA